MNNHPPIPDAELEELRRLHAEATPGEWKSQVPAWNKNRRNCKTAVSSATGTVCNTVTPKVSRDGVIGYLPPSSCRIAEYIAALNNAFPALIARLQEAEREREEVRADAERYRYLRSESLIHWGQGKLRNKISWPTIRADDPIDGGKFRDRFDAAIDKARLQAEGGE